MLRVAHVSDLHLGKNPQRAGIVSRLVGSLLRQGVDWVCCTGDITERGKAEEASAFARLFAPLKHKLTIVPGNHDRLGDNVAGVLSKGACWVREGCAGQLRMVCVDSTQEANNTLIIANGELKRDTCDKVIEMTKARRPEQSVLVLIHHHLVKQPADDLLELFSDVKGLPFASCLKRGQQLADALVGHAAGVLHGHKHKANVIHVRDGGAVLPVVNAGSTSELLRYRIMNVDANEVIGEQWVAF